MQIDLKPKFLLKSKYDLLSSHPLYICSRSFMVHKWPWTDIQWIWLFKVKTADWQFCIKNSVILRQLSFPFKDSNCGALLTVLLLYTRFLWTLGCYGMHVRGRGSGGGRRRRRRVGGAWYRVVIKASGLRKQSTTYRRVTEGINTAKLTYTAWTLTFSRMTSRGTCSVSTHCRFLRMLRT